jgi:two-component system response regulator FixJ
MRNEAVVHVIDDDEAARDSLSFLLHAADLTVETYESAAHFLDRLPGLARAVSSPTFGCHR